MINGVELPPERAMPEARAAVRQEALERYVTASAQPRERRLPRRFAVTVVGVPLILSTGAAMAYVALKPASVPVAQETRCYSSATLSGGDDFPGTTVGQASAAEGQTRAQAAVDICGALWRQGLLTLGAKGITEPVDRTAADLPVPALVACTLEDGVAAVMPGDEGTCARLGLPRLRE